TAISNAQQAADAAKKVADEAAAAAKGAASDADAAKKAAAAAQTAADNAQGAADAVAADLKKAVENAASQIQEAVKNLATKDEVTAAVKVVADKYDAQAKELKALSDRLDKVEAKLGLGEGGEDIDLTEIQDELEDIQDAFEALVGVVSDMVTSVELVYSSWANGYTAYNGENDLDFEVVTEKERGPFGVVKENNNDVQKTDKTYSFVKNDTKFYGDEVYVRVNPVDAELTKEDISLINSKGEELTGIVDVVDVQPYSTDDYLTRAANKRTGLWAIKFAPAAGQKVNDLKGYWEKGGKKIVYAVAVKSAISDSIASDRRVVSAYDVTMQTTNAKSYVAHVDGTNQNYADLISLKVGGTDIKSIKNRYGNATGDDVDATLVDYYWNGTPNVAVDGTEVDGDKRTSADYLVAQVGKDINIEFDKTKKIKGFYVMLDYDYNEQTSTPSERNAWNSYKYINVGTESQKATMIDGNKGAIQVSSLNGLQTGDYIGFRIYAVNLDGTLVDPDGIAFYVAIGEQTSDDINLTAQKILVTKAVSSQGFDTTPATAAGNLSGEVALPSNAFANFTLGTVSCVNTADSNDKPADTNYQVLYKVGSNWQGAFAANATAIKVQIKDATAFKDGATYKITLPLQKSVAGQSYTVKNAIVNITKDMPTSCPTFIWKTNQTELQALVPANGSYANDGTKKDGILNFKNMFIVADGSEIDADYSYVFKLAGSEINTSDNNKTVDLYRAWADQYYFNGSNQVYTTYTGTGNSYQALIANKFIDNATSHALTTEYNYGDISNDSNKNPFKLSSSNYNLTYTTWSIQSADYMSYAWKKVDLNHGAQGTTPNMQPTNFLNTVGSPSIKIANILTTPGQMINGNLRQANLDAYICNTGGTVNNFLKITKVETKSNTNFSITNEYYEVSASNIAAANTSGVITFTLKNTGNTVPNHSAKVWITVKDCFQHEEVIKLDVEFKAISGTNDQLASN
ncbi:MAG: hypothetical protein ACI3Y0_01470, partial [Prevotella sp.]